jgi:hypothetical protein
VPVRRLLAGLLAGALLGGLPGAGWAATGTRYSGTVERVDLEAGVVVVGELVERGRLVRHEIHVDPATPIVSSRRLKAWEMRGPSAYGEEPVSLVDLLPGDFVIVESAAGAGGEAAHRLTIVEPAGSPATRPRRSP